MISALLCSAFCWLCLLWMGPDAPLSTGTIALRLFTGAFTLLFMAHGFFALYYRFTEDEADEKAPDSL